MTLDRKLLLIAPAIVLLFVVGGMFYATAQLRGLSNEESTWRRSDFMTSVVSGKRPITARQATSILRYAVDVERYRTAALAAASDLLLVLSIIAAASLLVLAEGVRRVPREHWPRFERTRAPRDDAVS